VLIRREESGHGAVRRPAAGALRPVGGHARDSRTGREAIVDESPFHFPEQLLCIVGNEVVVLDRRDIDAVAQIGEPHFVALAEFINAGSVWQEKAGPEL
jgi:hypothetical protein